MSSLHAPGITGNGYVSGRIFGEFNITFFLMVRRSDVDAYWGYRVRVSDVGLGRVLKMGSFDLVIATSRRGVPFMKVADELVEHWNEARRVLVAFGSPSVGLYEILKREGVRLPDVASFVVNLVPNQGTETVRTEEALYISLALLNTL